MEIANPRAHVEQARSRLERALGRRDAVSLRLNAVVSEIHSLESEEELLDLVSGLFRTLIDSEVTDNVQAVEKLLSEGLQTIFDDMDLRVKAVVETQRGKVSLDLITVQKQPTGVLTEASSTEAYGGSVSTVQSVLLRLTVILRRKMRPLLLLDESLGAVADHYVPAVGRFLSQLSKRLQVDVLAVTHNPTLVEAADKAYRIRKVGGKASFKEER